MCVHPGWEIFIGWMAICDSWLTIFANTENIKFTIIDSKIRIYNEAIAIISCLENVEVIKNKVKLRSGVFAINTFEYNKNNKKWLLIHHHGSPLLEDFPLPAKP
ncbi:MAG TPA: nuclear transport factor 2 family protein [Nitrososphaeraceae archaeon]|nr:nuclear transport factor 2 family protein [Nitrososphaeraceae archaeon]